jgi:hypothetical protein
MGVGETNVYLSLVLKKPIGMAVLPGPPVLRHQDWTSLEPESPIQ